VACFLIVFFFCFFFFFFPPPPPEVARPPWECGPEPAMGNTAPHQNLPGVIHSKPPLRFKIYLIFRSPMLAYHRKVHCETSLCPCCNSVQFLPPSRRSEYLSRPKTRMLKYPSQSTRKYTDALVTRYQAYWRGSGYRFNTGNCIIFLTCLLLRNK